MSLVYTFGCRLNTYESQRIKNILDDLGLQNVIAINTCTITNEAERQARQKIRQFRKLNPNACIVITGCAAELHMDLFFKMPEVNFVINNDGKLNYYAYLQVKEFMDKPKEAETHMIFGKTLPESPEEINYIYNFENKSRAYLKIQDGCNHYCSFCIVPFVRGKMRSMSMDRINIEIENLINNGYNEIVLTGVDITDYGSDIKDGRTNLSNLCEDILNKFPKLTRLRLSSVDVSEVDDKLFELLTQHDRFASYLHISLQSGNNEILRKMRRRHKREDVIAFCQRVLKIKPFASFGADIITGFPSETQEQFLDSYNLVKEANIAFMHAFPYSKKEKTLAFSMLDDVPKEIKKERVHQLIEIGSENLLTLKKSMLGHSFDVVAEAHKNTRASNFVQIKVDQEIPEKKLVSVFCKEILDNEIIGVVNP